MAGGIDSLRERFEVLKSARAEHEPADAKPREKRWPRIVGGCDECMVCYCGAAPNTCNPMADGHGFVPMCWDTETGECQCDCLCHYGPLTDAEREEKMRAGHLWARMEAALDRKDAEDEIEAPFNKAAVHGLR